MYFHRGRLDVRREQRFIAIFFKIVLFYVCMLSRTFTEDDVKQKLEL